MIWKAFEYPFANDGQAYFGGLARAYSAPDLLSTLNALTQKPAFIFFLFILIFLRIFGFSYAKTLVAQSLFLILQVLGIGRLFKWALPEGKTLPGAMFALTCLGFCGFFTAFPANLFDFRQDMSGGLFFVLALLALPRKNWTTAVLVGLAFEERFHNLSVLGVTSIVLIGLDLLSKGFNWKRIWGWCLWPSIGVLAAVALRWEHTLGLVRYYKEVQLSSSSDYVVAWGSAPGFWTFYPRALAVNFLKPWGLATLLFAFWILYKNRKVLWEKTASWRPYLLSLLCGTAVAGLLLLVNPTRNNEGVLRFAVAPGATALALCLYSLWLQGIDRFKIKLFLALAAVSTLASGLRFYSTFDYFGARAFDYHKQLNSTFDRIRELSKGDDLVLMGSFYAFEYNFNHDQWDIHTAHRGLDKQNYTLPFGVQNRIMDINAELLEPLERLDFVNIPTKGCWLEHVPADKVYREYYPKLKEKILRQCPTVVSNLNLAGCESQVRQCKKVSKDD